MPERWGPASRSAVRWPRSGGRLVPAVRRRRSRPGGVQDRVTDAIRRAVKSGRFPGRTAETIAVQLWSLVHGLASIELLGYLGDEQQAAAHWRDAVAAALTGYQQPS